MLQCESRNFHLRDIDKSTLRKKSVGTIVQLGASSETREACGDRVFELVLVQFRESSADFPALSAQREEGVTQTDSSFRSVSSSSSEEFCETSKASKSSHSVIPAECHIARIEIFSYSGPAGNVTLHTTNLGHQYVLITASVCLWV